MKIEKLLFPTKFGELDLNSLESIFPLKDAGLKEVVLYYVIPREEVGFVPYGGYLKEEEQRIREEARIRFEDWQKKLTGAAIDSRIVIEVGDPVADILKTADKEGIDMIVIGRKKIGADRSLFGSRTTQIVTRSLIPVLVSKYMVEVKYEGETVTRINKDIFGIPLLASDWSKPSLKALELLTSFNGIVQKAHICHVIDVKISGRVGTEELHRIEKESKYRLDGYKERLESAGIQTEVHLGAGKSPSEIIRISRDVGATMIIIGTTGKDRLQAFVIGSTSHRVAQLSELPTLLVP